MHGGEPTHPGGTKKVLTATAPQSLDVFLGQKLKGSPPFDSLQLGVATQLRERLGQRLVHRPGPGGQARRQPAERVQPAVRRGRAPMPRRWRRADGGSRCLAASTAEEERARRHPGRPHRAAGQAGHAPRSRRLDIHLQSLRDVEARATSVMMPRAAAACPTGPGRLRQGRLQQAGLRTRKATTRRPITRPRTSRPSGSCRWTWRCWRCPAASPTW